MVLGWGRNEQQEAKRHHCGARLKNQRQAPPEGRPSQWEVTSTHQE